MVFSIDSLVVVGMFRWDVKRTDVSWMSNVFVVRWCGIFIYLTFSVWLFEGLLKAWPVQLKQKLYRGHSYDKQLNAIAYRLLEADDIVLSPAILKLRCSCRPSLRILRFNYAFVWLTVDGRSATVIGMTFSAVAKLNTSEYAQKCRIRGYGNYLNFNQYHSATWAPLPKWQQFFVFFLYIKYIRGRIRTTADRNTIAISYFVAFALCWWITE